MRARASEKALVDEKILYFCSIRWYHYQLYRSDRTAARATGPSVSVRPRRADGYRNPALERAEWQYEYYNRISEHMPYLKGNLHVHTTYSDGHFSPERMAGFYRDLGFDFIAVTDHEYLLKPAYKELFPLDVEGIMVFEGVELEPKFLHYHHVLQIKGALETLYVLCHPDQYRLPIKEVNRRIEMFNREGPGTLDAMEVTCSGFYTSAYDTPEIPIVKIATDDAHDEHSCGKAWIEVNCGRDKDSIIRAIRAGDVQIGLLSGRRKSVGQKP